LDDHHGRAFAERQIARAELLVAGERGAAQLVDAADHERVGAAEREQIAGHRQRRQRRGVAVVHRRVHAAQLALERQLSGGGVHHRRREQQRRRRFGPAVEVAAHEGDGLRERAEPGAEDHADARGVVRQRRLRQRLLAGDDCHLRQPRKAAQRARRDVLLGFEVAHARRGHAVAVDGDGDLALVERGEEGGLADADGRDHPDRGNRETHAPMIEDLTMRASAAALAFLACLAAAAGAWTLRRHVEDADLVAAAIALVAIGGGACALLRRRLVAGLAVLVAGAGVWAATGGVDLYLLPRAPYFVGAPLAIALVALVFASAPSEAAGRARRE